MYGRWRRAKPASFELSMHPVVRAVTYDADLLQPVKYGIYVRIQSIFEALDRYNGFLDTWIFKSCWPGVWLQRLCSLLANNPCANLMRLELDTSCFNSYEHGSQVQVVYRTPKAQGYFKIKKQDRNPSLFNVIRQRYRYIGFLKFKKLYSWFFNHSFIFLWDFSKTYDCSCMIP